MKQDLDLTTPVSGQDGKPAHSHIGASSMYRWSACPGSVRLSKGLPNVASKYAEEGTDAHEKAAFRLVNGHWPKDTTEEMQEHLQIYTTAVLEQWNSNRTKGSEMLIEHKFDLTEIYDGLYGTGDTVLYFKHLQHLDVYDLKYGAGIPVEVENNEQLMYYGLGALLSLKKPCKTITLHIAQPRCFHVNGPIRSWTLSALELLYFADDLKKAAIETEKPDAPLVPGKEHCHFCPAKGICPALHKTAIETAQLEFRSDLSYDPAKLASTLELLPAIEAWAKGVREFAYGEALHGRTPPGFKLVAKRATRSWIDEKVTIQWVKKNFTDLKDDQIYEPRSLKSVAQFEKALDKGAKTQIAPLVQSISSGSSLVPESDSRPEIDNKPENDFQKIETTDFKEINDSKKIEGSNGGVTPEEESIF